MTLIARIDERNCLAHGDCALAAPEAFRVDDVAVVIGETTDERLAAAARACPAGAVVLFDARTGEDVDP
jgi:ferredoxin